MLFTKSTLRVGDEIEFIIEAFDPNGREIEYKCESGLFNSIVRVKNNIGIFKIIIPKEMIAKNSPFRLSAKTDETAYKNEATISIHYAIIP